MSWWSARRRLSAQRKLARRVFSHFDTVPTSTDETASSRENPNTAGKYSSNVVKTSKYSLLSFLPKNLFEQFKRAANFYFLVVMVIALVCQLVSQGSAAHCGQIPDISPVTPVTSILPLVFVISMTAVKQAWEDYKVNCILLS